MPALTRILSAPLRPAPADLPAVRMTRALRTAPLLPAPVPVREIGRVPRERPGDDAPLRRWVLEFSAPPIARVAPSGVETRGSQAQAPRVEERLVGPLAPRTVEDGRADETPPAPAPRPTASPPATLGAAPAAHSASTKPIEREPRGERPRREAAPAAPPTPTQPPPPSAPARSATADRTVAPTTPTLPAPARGGAAREQRQAPRPAEPVPEAPASALPPPPRPPAAAERALHAARTPVQEPRPSPAVPAASPPSQQIVHLHEPAPPQREPRTVATALRPSPPPAPYPVAPAPPPGAAAAPEPAHAAVSIEIGRIEIRTAQPSTPAPPKPPRRTTPPRRHVIDPGLRLGGGRRW